MNLHIVSNSTIANDLIDNLEKLNLLQNNLIVIRDRSNSYVKNNPPFAPLYSSKFKSIVGNLERYDKVFMHQFSPLMYRWVAVNKFKQLNWIVWGADLYNILNSNEKLYEELTFSKYIKRNEVADLFSAYNIKVLLTNSLFKKKAYSKVDNVLTWMRSEYEFAKQNINSFRAEHKYFMYGSRAFMKFPEGEDSTVNNVLRIIVGNSGTPTNNHLDSLKILMDNQIKAHLIVPLSYGDEKYISFLKENFGEYKLGPVQFIENFMPLLDYARLLQSADALIMNCVRPQGFGNIFMMMVSGKPVFFNKRNYAFGDLVDFKLKPLTLEDIPKWFNENTRRPSSVESLNSLLSQERIDSTYQKLFGAPL